MISNYSPLQSVSYTALPSVSAGGRAYIPVQRSQLIYAHFKYVSGVPAKEWEKGVSVDKLKILNTLIDRLMNMKTSEFNKKPETVLKDAGTEEAQIDRLIDYYRGEIKKAEYVRENFGYGFEAPSSAIINLTV